MAGEETLFCRRLFRMASESQPYRILHVGDLHFWQVPVDPVLYAGKRVLGIGNLLVGGRCRRFRMEFAPGLVEKLSELAADLVLMSGDFSTTTLKGEFLRAAKVFAPLTKETPPRIYSVPGNHDCYTRRDLNAATFVRYLGRAFHPERRQSLIFPEEGIALFRLNAATNNGIGSHGKIEQRHLDFVENKLSEVREKARQVVFLCHFPPEDPPGVLPHDRGPQLLHAEEILRLLNQLGLPVLWMHGHHHHRWVYGSPKFENITYLNAGAPLLRRKAPGPDLGFHEILWSSEQLRLYSHRLLLPEAKWLRRSVNWPGQGEYQDLQEWDEKNSPPNADREFKSHSTESPLT